MRKRRRGKKKSGGGGRRRAVMGFQMGEPNPGEQLTFSAPFKFPSASKAETEARISKLISRIQDVLEEPEFSDVELCENGEESMRALSLAFLGQQAIAELRAARKARDN